MFEPNYDLTVKNVRNLNAQLKEAYEIIDYCHQNDIANDEPSSEIADWLTRNSILE